MIHTQVRCTLKTMIHEEEASSQLRRVRQENPQNKNIVNTNKNNGTGEGGGNSTHPGPSEHGTSRNRLPENGRKRRHHSHPEENPFTSRILVCILN
ncbi:hypothetical protein QL285_031799 [Trifolium repens]|nr:hypothetical protein QL285_031799 [Trifolium repens]